ncbi:Acyltransferase family protein [Enterobacter sp. DC1]|uniref:acyltransferase family protein n=1 Tax=Enterobacter asburiae TaxID=61645 RepID=UPI0003ED0D1E|nr:acyltransferase [Enterobacter asburiae]ELP5714831.1 acyltransferase [Enterobacter asburiae]EWG72488.1 Acyltransferase family protein [Enterobacter sp. DC1]
MILNIQYLRFLAAFTVIFAHANLSMYGIPPSLTNLAAIGVDIFFVISGFIMPYIIFAGCDHKKGKIKSTAGEFFMHRFIRVWPMYFVSTAAFIFVSYLNANGFIKNPTTDFTFYFNDYRYKIDYIIQSLSFTNDARGPILTAGWTLQLEFVFYSLMALCIVVGMRKFWHFFFTLACFFTLLQIAKNHYQSDIINQLSRPFLLEFLSGMFIYYLFSAKILLNKHMSLILIGGCIISIFALPINLNTDTELKRVLLWGSISSIIVYSALSLERYTFKSSWLLFAGNSSYSLYLTHGILAPIIAFTITSNDALNKINLSMYLLLYTIICLTTAFLSYRFIETKLTKALKMVFLRQTRI